MPLQYNDEEMAKLQHSLNVMTQVFVEFGQSIQDLRLNAFGESLYIKDIVHHHYYGD